MSKTQVDDIDRNIYDIKNKDDYEFKMKTEKLLKRFQQRKMTQTG